MKKRALIFAIVLISAFVSAVIAKQMQTPTFNTVDRPILGNLKPWNSYIAESEAFSLSYPSYLIQEHGVYPEEDTIVLFSYKKSRSYNPDHPHVRISRIQSTLSLTDWFELSYGEHQFCQEHQVTCIGVTVPTPTVLSGHTALQFKRIDEKYRDTVTAIKLDTIVLTITNHSTPEGRIPDATYEEMLSKVEIQN